MAQQNSSELIVQENWYDGMIHDYGYLNQIYNNLNSYINNPIGTVALMANLYAESNCSPNRLQGDTYGAPTYRSIDYTNDVNNLTYTRQQFTHDQKGYGLAQWTIIARKTLYYDYAPIATVGIGDINRALGYLHAELRGDYASQGIDYRSTLTACQNATDLHTCTDYVLDHFENPATPDYGNRERIADDLWDYFFGSSGRYSIYVTTSGNGTAYAMPTVVNTGDTYDLTCTPASGESLIDIVAMEISTGMYIAIPVVTGTQTVPFNSASNISISVSFTGTPPTPPTPPTQSREKLKGMPIWMYPQFRV